MSSVVEQAAYLVGAVLFILGIMRLRTPASARSGNTLAAIGMVIALAATLAVIPPNNVAVLIISLVVGAAVGAAAARSVRMTAMPQMVALFNGMGGGAAALVAISETLHALPAGGLGLADVATALFTVLIGLVSFSGSLLAFAKLQELMTGRPITFPGQKTFNIGLLIALVIFGVVLIVVEGVPLNPVALLIFALVALAIGVLIVLPIGGADMPVIISFLNSCTGLAAASSGFILGNNMLIIAGALVGASGAILTQLMSRAMNRSLGNIFFGAFGALATGAGGADAGGTVRATSAEDVANLLAYARQVVIVPGYGLAVARAQREVSDLMEALLARGVDVKFGIHPVAGRMPGHMNVLLAEADISYDRLYEMEAINPEFPRTDVALVIGANDVTNPAARTDRTSPLFGMPILNVDQARTVVVMKRGMSPGFAGIDNALYVNQKTLMLFGDARSSVIGLLNALKEVA